jgi:glycine C-acetyltransferase
MALEKLNRSLTQEIEVLQTEGRAKTTERILVSYIPPKGENGPRYRLKGAEREFIRMNSNSYL